MSDFKDWFNEDDHDTYNFPEEAMESAWDAAIKSLIPKHRDPMPQTVEAWERLYGLAEEAMLRDKAEISRLKERLNKLEQKS